MTRIFMVQVSRLTAISTKHRQLNRQRIGCARNENPAFLQRNVRKRTERSGERIDDWRSVWETPEERQIPPRNQRGGTAGKSGTAGAGTGVAVQHGKNFTEASGLRYECLN
ncbi:hypothetical protein [Paraburkholderia bannensis]|uniref:hypothetical protein n=1 Tax=Paraburkholderia bannensis TaxID=765414 RepID=UPI002ABD1C26|nr:hypothetical protein [Paraburkholderia bannensis]